MLKRVLGFTIQDLNDWQMQKKGSVRDLLGLGGLMGPVHDVWLLGRNLFCCCSLQGFFRQMLSLAVYRASRALVGRNFQSIDLKPYFSSATIPVFLSEDSASVQGSCFRDLWGFRI